MKTKRKGKNGWKWTVQNMIYSNSKCKILVLMNSEIQMVANDYIIEENQMKIEKLSWGERHKSFCSMNLEEPKKNHL